MSEHRAYQLYAHITWHTWKRVGCVDSAAVADIERALLGACRRCTVRVLRWAALADHVHLLVSFRPHTRLSDFIRIMKSVSARSAARRAPGALKWARGYFVRSVCSSELARVSRYMARQELRHPDLVPRPTPGVRPGVPGQGAAPTGWSGETRVALSPTPGVSPGL
ncbi:MAG: IS200/IS605 family transposase [Gemmatimonadetes bacterium]|nr:IS200/IS605 family transposase [Gemmatimonadota bacterium]